MITAVIGSTGQLGTDIMATFGSHAVGFDHTMVQVESYDSVREALESIKPGIIINTAAFHNVGQCENDPGRAFSVNTLGARNVAVAGEKLGAKVVYISTDYVFSGAGGLPYTEFDRPDPLNMYGLSKLRGEEYTRAFCRRHFIIRVSGLVGKHGSKAKGGNFVDRILAAAGERPMITVVADQFFSPTFTGDAALRIRDLASTDLYGTYHITNSGWCSWHRLAEAAVSLAGLTARVEPVLASGAGSGVKRPPFSVLDNCHLRLQGFSPLRSWEEALAEYIGEGSGRR